MLGYFVLIFIVYGSGSALGWYIPGYNVMQLGVTLIYALWMKSKTKNYTLNKKTLLVFIVAVTVLILNVIAFSGVEALPETRSTLLAFVLLYIVVESMPRKEYIDKYINVMVVLASFSIVFWVLSRFGIELFDFVVQSGNGVYYRLNFLHVYRSNINPALVMYTNPRNQSIFWEPGALQGYINMALLFLLFDKSADKKKLKLKTFILVLCMVTTMSTMGYFVMALIFGIYYFTDVYKGRINVKTILVMLVMLVATVMLLMSDTVQDKFDISSDKYMSTELRSNDIISGVEIVLKKPMGLGYNSQKYYQTMEKYNILANSTGLLITLQQFGIFVGGVVLVWLYKNLYRNFRVKGLARFLLLCVYIATMMGESFVNKQIFMIFLLVFANDVKESSVPKEDDE